MTQPLEVTVDFRSPDGRWGYALDFTEWGSLTDDERDIPDFDFANTDPKEYGCVAFYCSPMAGYTGAKNMEKLYDQDKRRFGVNKADNTELSEMISFEDNKVPLPLDVTHISITVGSDTTVHPIDASGFNGLLVLRRQFIPFKLDDPYFAGVFVDKLHYHLNVCSLKLKKGVKSSLFVKNKKGTTYDC